jgi:hypothetical protein
VVTGGAGRFVLVLSPRMKKLLLKLFLSPGDVVMLTAAVRDLHRCYPGQFLTDVRTSNAPLWDHNPWLTPLAEDDPEVEVIDCRYPLINRANVAPYHCLLGFVEFLNERLGLQIKPTAFRGDIHLSPQEKAWFSQVHELTGEDTPFWIVAAGGKYDVTIKWWETRRYQEVVDHFRGRIQFVQVGSRHHHHPQLDGVIDLRGKTDLRQLVRLVHHAQGVLCPVTALMHLAAAVEVKGGRPRRRAAVVIAGGREPPNWEAYPHHQFIHTVGALPCCQHGGCWRARTVPLGDGDDRDQPGSLCVDVVGNLPRCMDMISSAEVIRRIESYFAGGLLNYLTLAQAEAAARGVARSNADFECEERLFVHAGTGTAAKAALIQQASGLYTQLLDVSGRRHSDYAARHHITFWSIRGDPQRERPPHWNKVLLIQRALRMGFELVVWLDADTLIVRPGEDFRAALPAGAPIGLCRHPMPLNGHPWHYNSGVIVVRNTEVSREFFDRVWQAGPVRHHWQEQVRINELAHQQPEAVQVLADRWNSTMGVTACPDAVVQAWHGRGLRAARFMHEALVATTPAAATPPANG